MSKTFEAMARVAMEHYGFVFDGVQHPENSDVVTLKFVKDGSDAFVSASGREILMNNTKETMISLVRARTREAIKDCASN